MVEIDENAPQVTIDISDPKNPVEIERKNMENFKLSDSQIDDLARAMYPSIVKFYQDPENVKRYEEWKRNKSK